MLFFCDEVHFYKKLEDVVFPWRNKRILQSFPQGSALKDHRNDNTIKQFQRQKHSSF